MSNTVGNYVSYGRPENKAETARIQRILREQDEQDELLRKQRQQPPPATPQHAQGS